MNASAIHVKMEPPVMIKLIRITVAVCPDLMDHIAKMVAISIVL